MARFRNSLPKEVRTLYTFGVEVEFIINFKIADFITAINTGSFHHPAEWKLLRAVYEHIINEMQSNGFLVNPYLQNHNNASYWTIKQATSIVTEEFDMAKDEWGGCPVRLVAPVMTYGSPSFDLINNVLIFLDQQFDIVVNASCSLNVHVGNIAADKDEAAGGKDLESLGFSLTTVENLLSFIWLFQLQLQEIHPHPGYVSQSALVLSFYYHICTYELSRRQFKVVPACSNCVDFGMEQLLSTIITPVNLHIA